MGSCRWPSYLNWSASKASCSPLKLEFDEATCRRPLSGRCICIASSTTSSGNSRYISATLHLNSMGIQASTTVVVRSSLHDPVPPSDTALPAHMKSLPSSPHSHPSPELFNLHLNCSHSPDVLPHPAPHELDHNHAPSPSHAHSHHCHSSDHPA